MRSETKYILKHIVIFANIAVFASVILNFIIGIFVSYVVDKPFSTELFIMMSVGWSLIPLLGAFLIAIIITVEDFLTERTKLICYKYYGNDFIIASADKAVIIDGRTKTAYDYKDVPPFMEDFEILSVLDKEIQFRSKEHAEKIVKEYFPELFL